MKAAFQELEDEYQDSSSVTIGDVDCTVHQDLCSRFSVQGYPTLAYWKDGVQEKYNGGRELDALRTFVVDNLQVLCTVGDPKDCSEKEKKFIESMKAKPDQIAKQFARLKNMVTTKVVPSLKTWLNQRLNILKQMLSAQDKDL